MKLFISYAHEDSELVDGITDYLDAEGIEFFLDKKSIAWGDELSSVIEKGLAEASHVMLILSPASVKSAWVAYEAGQARAHGKKLLPFLTHPSLDIPPFLRGLKYISTQGELRSHFKSSKETTLTEKEKDFMLILRYLQEVGVDDPEVDLFVATMENDVEDAKRAIKAGGTGMVTQSDLIQRHSKTLLNKPGIVAASIRSGFLKIPQNVG